MRLVQDCYQIQVEVIVNFLRIFGPHLNILSIFKVKILMLSKWSQFRSSQLCDY